jgi:hypothetical protein
VTVCAHHERCFAGAGNVERCQQLEDSFARTDAARNELMSELWDKLAPESGRRWRGGGIPTRPFSTVHAADAQRNHIIYYSPTAVEATVTLSGARRTGSISSGQQTNR